MPKNLRYANLKYFIMNQSLPVDYLTGHKLNNLVAVFTLLDLLATVTLQNGPYEEIKAK